LRVAVRVAVMVVEGVAAVLAVIAQVPERQAAALQQNLN
jgi:hypothetical protein